MIGSVAPRRYPSRPRKISQSGQYAALVAASDQSAPAKQRGVSGHAWEIRKQGELKILDSDAQASEQDDSGEWNGYASAVFRSVEAVPDCAELEIVSTHAPVVNAINEGWIDRWRAEGWRDSRGGKRSGWAHWQAFCEERDARQIVIRARIATPEERRRIQALVELAKQQSIQRAQELGWRSYIGGYVQPPRRTKRHSR